MVRSESNSATAGSTNFKILKADIFYTKLSNSTHAQKGRMHYRFAIFICMK